MLVLHSYTIGHWIIFIHVYNIYEGEPFSCVNKKTAKKPCNTLSIDANTKIMYSRSNRHNVSRIHSYSNNKMLALDRKNNS